jgi:predicted SnoaL-like aldol condensation-catalyzing enzyme
VKAVSELNKQKVRLFLDAVINEGRLELIDELLAADYVGRMPCSDLAVVGRDELRRLMTAHRLTDPDLYVKIDDEIAEDDLVVIRWRATTTTPGTGASPASLRTWSGISLVRLLAGMQVDSYTGLAANARGVVT